MRILKRLSKPNYLLYKLKIYLKLCFIGLNFPLIFLRLCFTPVKQKNLRKIVVLLSKPLGIGDLSMISPVFHTLKDFDEIIVLSSYENIFSFTGKWRQFNNRKELFEEASSLALRDYLLYLPKSSIKGLLFILKHMEFSIIAAISEGFAVDTINKKMFRLSANAGYSYKAMEPLFHLKEYKEDRIPKRLDLIRIEPPKQIKEYVNENSTRELIVLAPYTRWPTRRWGQDKWIDLINILLERGDFFFLLIGAASEQYFGNEIIERVAIKERIYNAMGEAHLHQLRGIFESAERVICCDNGPMHLALSCGVKVIALFGCTPYQYRFNENENAVPLHSYTSCHMAPCYTGYAEVVCPYECQCITGIEVDEVVGAAVTN